MAKLRFTFGTMGSGKSTQALQIHHNLRARQSLYLIVCNPKVTAVLLCQFSTAIDDKRRQGKRFRMRQCNIHPLQGSR